ncbi:UDP-N-acetylmuramate--L-alanine ligase [Siphonobacter sp.]|uniref:UDP-N-acetylmuramate--L-alanine ligase n=1 Tax=Siphonobacter sp. TaxID=1869184 RepID=UPI003B3A0309
MTLSSEITPSQRIHFIAIGGAAMHNLALVLHQKGILVTGSDDEIYEPAQSRLQQAGLLPDQMGWFPEKITPELDAVILGMHARADNPELLKAQELGIRVYSYPEFVYQQSLNKQRVVIAGSHGKTTTTAIILHVLKFFNRKFDYLVGARVAGFDTMVKLSDDAPVIVIEGDEYFSSPIDRQPKFLHYHPHITLISGIAWDHINVYPEFEEYVRQFELLAEDSPKGGMLIYDDTDDVISVICKKERPDVQPVGYGEHPHVIRDGLTYLLKPNGEEVPLKIFGGHNMKNLNGARIVLEKLGVEDFMFYEAIQSFSGAANRLERVGENDHTVIFRDFAHAPSKLEATSTAVKSQFPERKLVAVVELHTFSSLNKYFLPQYKGKFNTPDVAAVYYSPHTIEHKKLTPISPEDIIEAFGNPALQVFTDNQALKEFLLSQQWDEANLLLMSSGTFDGLNIPELVKEVLG